MEKGCVKGYLRNKRTKEKGTQNDDKKVKRE
jgi:hypothetical protein